MEKLEKGTFGYINNRKNSQMIKSVISFTIAFIIFLAGYLLNDNSKKNVFTVVAVLCILPATKILISYIVVFPFRSVGKIAYDEVKALQAKTDHLYTDLVFTSPEKIMNLSFLMVKGNKIIGLSQYKKANEKYIRKYLQQLMDDKGLPFNVKIMKNYKLFLNEIEKDTKDTVKDEISEELHKIIMSILV